MSTEPKTEDELYQDQLDAGISPIDKILRRVIRKDLDQVLLTDLRGVHHVPE